MARNPAKARTPAKASGQQAFLGSSKKIKISDSLLLVHALVRGIVDVRGKLMASTSERGHFGNGLYATRYEPAVTASISSDAA